MCTILNSKHSFLRSIIIITDILKLRLKEWIDGNFTGGFSQDFRGRTYRPFICDSPV